MRAIQWSKGLRRAGTASALFGAALFAAARGGSAQELKLIPQPRQVERRTGEFRAGAAVHIVLNAAHAKEDRVAAETLAEEIQASTGRKPRITIARSLPLAAAGTIYLARAGDDRRLRAWLGTQNLAMEEGFDPEGYVLTAEPRRIVVASNTGQGLFYGAQTLRQLLHPAETTRGKVTFKEVQCPAVRIKDWPAMRWRGIHVDISRGPIPTLDTMKRQVRIAAEYKLNLYSLYLENVFDYTSMPVVAPNPGALTADEMKELVAYAQRYYVTILPEQQTFGHLHHVLKYELYTDLAETPHGHVLSPANPQSYELIREMLEELAPLFPGPLFHIGSDETFELGTGQTKALAESEGLGRVYVDHLKRVAEIMKPYHKRLLFWGDIALHYPDLIGELPREMIAVPWAYDPRPSFDSELEPFQKAGLETIVAPGASNWNRIFPDLGAAAVNIRNFVRDGQRYHALGMLNTTWNDSGETIFAMSWPAVVFGAACAWQEGETSIEDFAAKYDWAFYRNDDSTFRDAIENLEHANTVLAEAGLGGAFDSLYWSDPFSEAGAGEAAKALPAAHELRLAAERALASLYSNRGKARAHADTLDALIFAGLRLDGLGMKYQFANECSGFYREAYENQSDRGRVGRDFSEMTGTNGRLEDLRDSTTRLRQAYAALWATEYRPYWLGNVLVRYDLQAERIQKKIEDLRAAQALFRTQGTLPPPEALGFYLKPQP